VVNCDLTCEVYTERKVLCTDSITLKELVARLL